MRPEKPVEEMTEEEKHFYHFKMYDYDNNNLLDGLEILQHEFNEDSHKKATKLDGNSVATTEDEHHDIQHLVGKRGRRRKEKKRAEELDRKEEHCS